MASLTNLFGAYASDEEGEASGDLKGEKLTVLPLVHTKLLYRRGACHPKHTPSDKTPSKTNFKFVLFVE